MQSVDKRKLKRLIRLLNEAHDMSDEMDLTLNDGCGVGSLVGSLAAELEVLWSHIAGGEDREPECRCYCVGDQADASDCKLHGGNR